MLSIDRTIAIFILLLSCLIGIMAIHFPGDAKVVPLLSLGVMILGAVGMLLRPKIKKENLETVNWKNLYKSILLTVALIFAFYMVGYFIASVLFLFIAMYAYGQKNKLILSVVPPGVTILLYIVFGKIISVPLPNGILFR